MAPNVFVALDRTLKITLNDGFHGVVTGEVLMVPERSSVASMPGGQVVRLLAGR